MRDRLDDLGTETDVAVITFAQPQHVAWYRDTNPLPFPVLADLDRDRYRAYGLGRGSMMRVYGWRMVKRYLEIYRADGFRWHAATEDTMQLGGDFVVDPDGTLVYGYWSAGPDDRPDIDDLIAAVAAGRA